MVLDNGGIQRIGHLPNQFLTTKSRRQRSKRERGKFSAYFLADAVGGFEIYKKSRAPAIKIREEFPVTDPFVVSSLSHLCQHWDTDFLDCSL
jgi:hypothetical protein